MVMEGWPGIMRVAEENVARVSSRRGWPPRAVACFSQLQLQKRERESERVERLEVGGVSSLLMGLDFTFLCASDRNLYFGVVSFSLSPNRL